MAVLARIIVDFQKMKCGSCKSALKDELAKHCKFCGAIFDGVISNHVGLAEKLREIRGEEPIERSDEDLPELVSS